MKTIFAGWLLTVTIGSMLEAVPAKGLESFLWSGLAVVAAIGFVHFSKDQP